MVWVVDCSVALSWLLPDEGSLKASAFFASLSEDFCLLVPPLFWYEVANVLTRARRSGRVAGDIADRILAQLASLGFETAPVLPTDAAAAVSLALVHTLSAYDAAYLDLAIARGTGLATLDHRLMAAATACKVPLPW